MDNLIGLPNDLFARAGTSDEGTWKDTFLEERAWHRWPAWVQEDLDFSGYDGLVVDLGANVGYTTFDYYERADTKIIAVEPDKENYSLLLLNMNGCVDVECENVAVSNCSGYGTMIGEAYNARKLSLTGGDVQIVLLDDIVWRQIRDKKPINFIKFDIEGSEKEIFKHGGDWTELTRCLVVELHDYSKDEAAKDLERWGFIVEERKGHDACLLAMK